MVRAPKHSKLIYSLIALLLCYTDVLAKKPVPPSPHRGPGTPGFPIDDNIYILLLSGLLLGLYFFSKKVKINKPQ